jgi:hypothetical protein
MYIVYRFDRSWRRWTRVLARMYKGLTTVDQALDINGSTPQSVNVISDKDSPCGVRWWTSAAPCPVEPGEHACWRTSEHRTHLCGCGEIKLPPARSVTLAEGCGYRWSDGRPCADGTPHVCTRQGEHGTHVCGCLASDTPSPVAVPV